MYIRRMRKTDYSQIDRLLLQIHELDLWARPDLFQETEHYMTRDSYESLIGNDNVIAILARQKSETVGCCFVSILERRGNPESKIAYIDLLVVDEKHRRKGIGTRLFREVEKRARALGARRVDLTVWNHNPVAISVYESLGMSVQRCVYELKIQKD